MPSASEARGLIIPVVFPCRGIARKLTPLKGCKSYSAVLIAGTTSESFKPMGGECCVGAAPDFHEVLADAWWQKIPPANRLPPPSHAADAGCDSAAHARQINGPNIAEGLEKRERRRMQKQRANPDVSVSFLLYPAVVMPPGTM